MLLNRAYADVVIPNPLGCDNFTDCLGGLLNGLFWISMPITAIMIMVGGFQILFANGNEEKVSGGKRTILYACVGFAVIMLSTAVTAVIQDILSNI